MDYSDAARRAASGGQSFADRALTHLPLYDFADLYGPTAVVHFKPARGGATLPELVQFLLHQLQVTAEQLEAAYIDHVTQYLLITFKAAADHQAALEKLRRGVPWPLAGGRLVKGWDVAQHLTEVRVSCIPSRMAEEALLARMAAFGQVVDHRRGYVKGLPGVFSGVLYLDICLDPNKQLPAFLQFRGPRGRLTASLAIHFDGCRRFCYRCGGDHVASFCKAYNKPEIGRAHV